VQGRNSTLADLTRYWIYIAKSLSKILPTITVFEPGYIHHVVAAYHKRAEQLITLLGRLALFLCPRTRDAALSVRETCEADFWALCGLVSRGSSVKLLYSFRT
jgi:hypothetical protein